MDPGGHARIEKLMKTGNLRQSMLNSLLHPYPSGVNLSSKFGSSRSGVVIGIHTQGNYFLNTGGNSFWYMLKYADSEIFCMDCLMLGDMEGGVM